MNIVYMGTPEFSAAFLRHLLTGPHRVIAAVTQPDRPAGRGRQLLPPPVKVVAQEAGLPVLQPESLRDAKFIGELTTLQADVFVVVAFSILPPQVLAAARLGAMNLHGSLLPRYRGAAPVQWAIAHGDKQTGVTVFILDEKMDHGPVLEQKTLDITEEDTTASLLDKMIPLGCSALDSALEKLSTRYEPIVQDHAQASPARKLRKEDGWVDWSLPARHIHDRIRAFTPWPGGYSYLNGRLVYLRKTSVATQSTILQPGEVRAEKECLLVGTGSGVLTVLEIQAEGKKNMRVGDYLRGIQNTAALRFESTPHE